jgi:site-specific recombinase
LPGSSSNDPEGKHHAPQGLARQAKGETKKTKEMSVDVLISLIPSLMAAVGVWVSLNGEVAKLKGRVYRLESDQNELKTMLKECVEGINELKILLAKKGI